MLVNLGGVEGSDPGLVDLAAQNFVLGVASLAIGAASPLAPAAEQRLPNLQYQRHQSAVVRESLLDAGAFESQ
jgi:hypothetical protein